MTPHARRLHNARLLYERARHIMPPAEELPAGWNDPGDWSGFSKACWLYRWRVKNGHLPEGETPEEQMELTGLELVKVDPS
jgi:hypothetical protein